MGPATRSIWRTGIKNRPQAVTPGTLLRGSRRIRAIAVLGLTLAAVGCGGAGERTVSTGSVLTVLHPGDRGIFSPDWPAQFLVFLPLVERSETGERVGRLAQSWEHSADYRRWTIHLRTDVRWHDGTPVTARDVKFTLDLLGHPSVAYHPGDAYTVSAPDDSTVGIVYQEGGGQGPLNTWTVYYPEHLLEDLDPAGFWEWEFWTEPVGNGPYRFVRRVPNTMVELEANPDHFAGPPGVDRIVLKTGHEYGSESSLVELVAGQVDAIPYVHPLALLKIQDDARFRFFYSVDVEHLTVLGWNQRTPFFQDPAVRRALAHAIDRQAVLDALNLPDELPLADVLYTERQYRERAIPEPLAYDPDRARALLDAAGWRDGDGDGVREWAAQTFTFTALTSDWQQAPRAAVLIQDQLRRVGVEMLIQQLDLPLLRERVVSRDFEAAVLQTSGPLRPEVLLGTDSPIGYENDRVSALIGQAATLIGPIERDRLYREVASRLREELPFVVLYPTVWATVAHRRVQGLSSPYRADPVRYADRVQLSDDER